ncbi:hypothetical protein BGZ95_011218, partial [Linnemannia exigua]
DLWPCLQVSRYWHDLFKPQALRYVRFADLKKHQTWTILNNAAGVHCLTIDIADAGWFLDNPYSPCINLRTLRCVDFGYVQPLDYNDYDFNLDYDDFNTRLAINPVDPRTNALNLVQLNPKLTTLEVIHGRQRYRANHITPSTLVSISKHQSLSLLKIDLDVAIPESFLVALLQHLPLSLEDLSFSAKDVRTPSGALPAMTGLTLRERNNLRRITIRPCSIWFYEDVTSNAERSAHDFILPLLQHSPQLVDLSLLRYCNPFIGILQTLTEFCPLVETIDYDGYSHASAEVAVLTGSLSHLREFRLIDYCKVVKEEEQRLIPNFLRRSSATLEVISVKFDLHTHYFGTNPLRIAAWNFWPECPRLREYTLVVDNDFEDIVPDHHCLDTLVELLSRPTVACWNLQKLGLWVNDHSRYEESVRHACKSRSQIYDHQQNFLQWIQPLYRCLRRFKRLQQEDLCISWNTCWSISKLNLDAVLPRINGHPILASHFQPPGPAHTRSSSNSESESPQLKEPEITRRELNWMGLGCRWASGPEIAEAVWMEKLHSGEYQNRDINARTAWAHNYKRVGCGWKDWESIAELRGCVPADDFWSHDCEHEDCFNEVPNDLDEGLDRMLSGYYIEIERRHRRRSMQRYPGGALFD